MENAVVVVIGMGFVGAACFAGFKKLGISTIGIESNKQKLKAIKELDEKYLESDICQFLGENRHYLDDIHNSFDEVQHTKNTCYLICVGTPSLEDGSADLTYIEGAISSIPFSSETNEIEVVIKSTVPPRTVSLHLERFCEENIPFKCNLISNPEFLREGHALSDFMNPDRILIGKKNHNSISVIENIYKTHFTCVSVSNTDTAEFSKYFSNSALSAMIGFSNEMRLFAEVLTNIDTHFVFTQFSKDRRWSDNLMKSYFWPGIGFGGYCLPKDTLALKTLMDENGFKGEILSNIISKNEELPAYFVDKILSYRENNERLVLFGASFKVGSDDIRNSRTINLINELVIRNEQNIFIYDEPAAKHLLGLFPEMKLVKANEIEPNDIVVVVLKNPSYAKIIKKLLVKKIINIPLLDL